MDGDTHAEGIRSGLEVRLARLEEQVRAGEKAVRLQAEEYKRRLETLNHAHEQIQEILKLSVTSDKFEEYIKTENKAREEAQKVEADKRELALDRVNEKFDDYVKRWEQIQSEQAQQIVTLSAAAAEAKRIAQDQGRQTREEADRMARQQQTAAELAQRKQTRNITVAGITLAAIVGLANLLPALL